jgi:AraC-like DNA-binding protein
VSVRSPSPRAHKTVDGPQHASPTTRSTFIPILANYLAATGIDPAELLRRFALPADAATMREVEVPLATARALYEAAEQRTGDENLGLHVALGRGRGNYGVLEFAARSAPTLRAACDRLVRYQRLINDIVQISFEPRGEHVVLEHSIPGEPLGFGRHCNEYGLAMFLLLVRTLARSRVVPRRVWLAHPAPQDRTELAAFFGVQDIVFAAGTSGMCLDPALFDLPIVSADPDLLPVMESCAEMLVASHAPPGDLSLAVRLEISRSLAGGPRVQEVAQALELSPRTLQRRLEEVDTSFNQLVDEVRMQRARGLLADLDLTIAEVARQLGYSEARPFLRAFKRWTGMTPQQLRSALAQAPASAPLPGASDPPRP